jgi:hypothetical protein
MKATRPPTRAPLLPYLVSLALLGAVAGSIGCAAPRPQQPGPSSEQLKDELSSVGEKLFLDLIREKGRLLEMEYRLNRVAAGPCGNLARPHYGVLAGGRETLEEDWLVEIAETSRILGEALTIVYVVPGSPFAEAGLRAGDELLSIDDESPRSNSELHALRMKTESLDPTRVVYRRDGEERTVEVPVTPTCPVGFLLIQSEELITLSRTAAVLVPRGLLAHTQDDDDMLAAALAHGLAHALWHEEGESTLARERRADRQGARIAAAAGFDPSRSVAYWEDVARAYPWLVLPEPNERKRSRPGSMEQLVRSLGIGEHHEIARRMEGIRRHAAEAKK